MITQEIIESTPQLKALDPETVAVLLTVSKNATDAVLNSRVNELTGEYSAKLAETATNTTKAIVSKLASTTGIEYAEGEDFDTYVSKLATVKDTEAKDWKARYDQTVAKLSEVEADAQSKVQKLTEEAKQIEVRYGFDKAVNDLVFRSDVSDAVKRLTVNAAKAEILSKYVAEKSSDGTLIFRDSAGMIVNNPDNLLNPITAKELLARELKDLLDTHKAEGGGTSGKKSSGGNPDIVDISEAKTREQALDIIKNVVLQKGITKTSPKFQEEVDKLWKANNVNALPSF